MRIEIECVVIDVTPSIIEEWFKQLIEKVEREDGYIVGGYSIHDESEVRYGESESRQMS